MTFSWLKLRCFHLPFWLSFIKNVMIFKHTYILSRKTSRILTNFKQDHYDWSKIRENQFASSSIVITNWFFLPIDVENHSGFRWFISQVGYGISYVIPFILKGFLTISGLLLICFLFWGKFQTYWQFICAIVLFFLFILISDNFWYGFLMGMVQCCVTYTVSEVIEDMKQPLFFRSRM